MTVTATPGVDTPTLGLAGKRVVVAGGSKGIGRAMALAFAAAGADVSICARGEAALADVRERIAALGVRAHSGSCDLGDATAIDAYVASAAEALGGIDVLVNNATGYGMTNDEDGWAKSIGVDLMGAVRTSRAALPWLRKGTGACILHTVSISAFYASPRSAPYAAIKAAVSHYAMSQALELAPEGIRVNAIAPGSVDFEDGLWDRRRTEDPELYQRTLATIPFGRFGRPEDIANAALFLCSPLAAWVTGQTLSVDGGQILT
ncbi:3-oxoacyl-[acyl-carrier protein] reductase [Luteibacter rhizovicinus]|uniref:3-oxoacyl-[acyl-carrier protein] reductase n=1 Tax=Luteibacter rhizovicinus TaxID=242606 RepID=A0A4R3Z062_9GAMM|nr:SDR family NAD(P)-dependent oxidoreductase [Luteibacter rhizovicinus]TCV97063.1 3-oxoacyl-[acyl-carrier protein] reductase [Luteibacter rhizovicinus]